MNLKMRKCLIINNCILRFMGRIAVGQPGQTYNVLSSQDLVNWTVIGTITLDATGSGQVTDPASSSLPNSYYRLQGQ